MNDIGVVEIELPRPIFFDPYRQSRAMGSFVLIDAESNATAAAGMIREKVSAPETRRRAPDSLWPHRPAVLLIPEAELAGELERRLLIRGCAVVRTRVQNASFWRRLLAAGAIVLVEAETDQAGGERPLPHPTRPAGTVLAGSVPAEDAELRLEPLFAAASEPAPNVGLQFVTAEETIRALENKKILDRLQSADGQSAHGEERA